MADDLQLKEILAGLNSRQRAAVTSPAASLQILAPPGSGKTKTLTSRVAYLLKHEEYWPCDIIVATFTVKAAKEMRERIGKMIGSGLEKKLILGTFHSICYRYLVRYGKYIGLQKGFSIADSETQLEIIATICKEITGNKREKGYEARSRISKAKTLRQNPAQLRHALGNPRHDDIIRIYEEYEAALAKQNLLDYDDLLLRFADLLEQRPLVVSNIEAVLVDEFQDTNSLQYDLMKLMASAKRRVTIVGDPDQSIYGFRCADKENLVKMSSDFQDTVIINLEQNYRSTGRILSAASQVIEQDKQRPQKSMLAVHGPGTQPVLRKHSSSAHEALWIVEEVRNTIDACASRLDLNDIAILIRSAYLSRVIETAFGKAGVPYRMVGSFKFYDRVEIKLILNYLQVVCSPKNNEALLKVINVPSRKIGKKSIDGLKVHGRKASEDIWTILNKGKSSWGIDVSKAAQKGVLSFIAFINDCRRMLLEENYSIVELIDYVADGIDLYEYLEKTYPEEGEADKRMDNVEELKTNAEEYTKTNGSAEADDELPHIKGVDQAELTPIDTLARFLAGIFLTSESQKDDEEAKSKGAVTISTIHSAKGLEWPVVFVPALYSGSIPHYRAEDMNEERRLLYVAITRAKSLLFLSHPESDSRGDYQSLSSFITDIRNHSTYFTRNVTLNLSTVNEICKVIGRESIDAMPSSTFTSAKETLKRSSQFSQPLSKKLKSDENKKNANVKLEGFKSATARLADTVAAMQKENQRPSFFQYASKAPAALSQAPSNQDIPVDLTQEDSGSDYDDLPSLNTLIKSERPATIPNLTAHALKTTKFNAPRPAPPNNPRRGGGHNALFSSSVSPRPSIKHEPTPAPDSQPPQRPSSWTTALKAKSNAMPKPKAKPNRAAVPPSSSSTSTERVLAGSKHTQSTSNVQASNATARATPADRSDRALDTKASACAPRAQAPALALAPAAATHITRGTKLGMRRPGTVGVNRSGTTSSSGGRGVPGPTSTSTTGTDAKVKREGSASSRASGMKAFKPPGKAVGNPAKETLEEQFAIIHALARPGRYPEASL